MAEKVTKKIIVKKKKSTKNTGKASKLTSMILIFSSVLTILIFVTFFTFKDFVKTRNSFGLEIQNLKKHEKSLLNQISELEDQSATAQKFITMWREEFTDAQKSREGISINFATELLKKISKNHNISNLQINFSKPSELSGIFEKNSIEVSNTLISIKFDTITDINVLRFIEDIENQIPNFIILTSLNMTRTTKISEEYFESLKNGVTIPTLKAELNMRWYGISSINQQ